MVLFLLEIKFNAEKNMDMLQEEVWGRGGARRRDHASFSNRMVTFLHENHIMTGLSSHQFPFSLHVIFRREVSKR